MAQSLWPYGSGRVTLWTQTFAEQITLPIHGFYPMFTGGRLRKLLGESIYHKQADFSNPEREGFFEKPRYPKQGGYKRVRSRLRYWMASETWAGLIVSRPSRSAMVLAILRMRV